MALSRTSPCSVPSSGGHKPACVMQDEPLSPGAAPGLDDANRDLYEHVGKVKSVRVVNFKNHDHFQMQFG